jgi:hypothetical protein
VNSYFATLVKADGARVPLFPSTRFSATVIDFAHWENAYLLAGHWRTGHWPPRVRRRGDAAILFWLYRDGTYREVAVPYGYWDQSHPPSALGYRASKAGLLVIGRRFEDNWRADFAGLFLMRDEETPVRLLSGIVRILGVSADGCRVAVAHRPVYGANELGSTAKIVDVCKGLPQ